MHRTVARFASNVLAFAILIASTSAALAANNDKEAEALVSGVLEVEVKTGKLAEAVEKLELARQACEGRACSPKVRAKVYIAIGTVLADLKQPVEAKAAFVTALKEDATEALFPDVISPEAQKAFNDARGVATASGGTAETRKAPGERRPKKSFPGGRAPRGWRSAEAAFYYSEAQKSERAREWLECTDYAQASLTAENRPTTRYLAATCEERAGLWIEAFGDYQIVADVGPRTGLYDVASRAKSKSDELGKKIPKIVIRPPARVTNLVVKMNDAVVPPEKLGGELWINPGERTVSATAKLDGADVEFEQVVTATEFETTSLDIKPLPKGTHGRDQVIMKCMLAAQTRDDFAKCLNSGTATALNVHAGLEMSGYHDTDHVDVVTPALFANVESPTGGWGFGASILVDVVTAASVDIVANASPRWREVRYVPSVNAHKKFGGADVSINGTLSDEPDYLATSAGVGVTFDLAAKTITPTLKYQFSYDISGRSGTPFSVYSHNIVDHALDLSSTFVLDKATIFSADATAVFETGDSSKPYRYIPMFSPDIASQVPDGFAIDSVNAFRLPIRPLEQLPTNRQRWALAGLVAHRFTSSTIRAEERLYIDSWGLKASTTDLQYLVDVTRDVRVWPEARLNAQTGVDFWRLAYASTSTGTGANFVVPAYRTGDRELGPLVGFTLGGGTRFAFGEKKNWALTVTASVVDTQFFETLYILQRWGFFGTTTLEVDFE